MSAYLKYFPSLLILLLLTFTSGAIDINAFVASKATNEQKADTLADYIFTICDRQPDSALYYSFRSREYAIISKSQMAYGNSLDAIGWSYFQLAKNDSAKFYLSKAQILFHAIHKDLSEAAALINLSCIYEAESEYEKALQYSLISIKLCEPLKDTHTGQTELAISEKMIGIINRKLGYNDKAKYYLRKAVEDFIELHNQQFLGDAVSSLGSVYYSSGQMDSANYCYHRALQIFQSINRKRGAAICAEDIARVAQYKSSKQPKPWLDSALYYYNTALTIFTELKNPDDVAYEEFGISEILTDKKDYTEAEKHLQRALARFYATHQASLIYGALDDLSIIYDSTHNYKKAYSFLKLADTYNDTLNKQSKDKAIADMLGKYEADKKDRTIALLNAEKELAEHKVVKTRLEELFAILLIVFSVIVTLTLLNRSRIKQKLYEMQMRNQIANDLHDDIGSSLSSILLLSKIAANSNDEGKDTLVHKITNNAQDVMERISDIVWTTNPKFDDGDNLREKIISYTQQVQQMSDAEVVTDISEAISKIKFSMELRRNIFLIIKEAINNVLKHAHATKISVSLSLEEKVLWLKISDNGVGFDNKTPKGNGLETMRMRTEVLKGVFHYTSAKQEGTQITIKIPLTNIRYV